MLLGLFEILHLGAPGSFIATQGAAAERSWETSPSEGLIEDSKAFAEQAGWTLDQALTLHEMSEKVDWIQEQIASKRPDQFIGGVLPSEPTGTPKVYIKGEADDFVRGIVAAVGTTITIIDGQPFSREELHERQNLVVEKLVEMGIKGFSVHTELPGRGTVTVEIDPESNPKMSEKEISDRVLANTGISVNIKLVKGTVKAALLDRRAVEGQETPSDQSNSWQPGILLIALVVGLVVLLGIATLRAIRRTPRDS